MRLKATEFATLILTALVMGVFWGTWFTLTRSLNDFSPAEFIHIGKVIIANVAGPMSVLMPLTLLSMLLAVWQVYRINKSTFYLYLASFLLMIVTLIITLAVMVPIDNQIAVWSPESIPANWESLRRTWDNFHTVRTFTSILSFGAFCLGTLVRDLN
jgi:uncharacterized membrane protein